MSASKDNVIDMGEYSYRIRLLRMAKDPIYFAQHMGTKTELSIFQKLYLNSIIGIDLKDALGTKEDEE